jgi:hypothetical protein
MGCPGCRKPLPRCSLCLVHMGTPSTQPQKPPNVGMLHLCLSTFHEEIENMSVCCVQL